MPLCRHRPASTNGPASGWQLLVAWLLLIGLCLLMPGCKNQPVPAKGQPPATVVGNRDAALEARDSLLVACLDAALERVTDLRSPEQVATLLRTFRAGFRVVPTAADVAVGKATVDAIVRGDPVVPTDTAKLLADRDAAHATAIKAEQDARAAAEKALKEERERAAAELAKRDSAELKRQQLLFRSTGAALIGLAGLILVLSKLTGWKWALGLAALGFMALGVAQMIGQAWFMPVFYTFLGVLALAAIAGVFIGVRSLARLRAGDDVIGGVEDRRAIFKNPTAEMAEIVRNAGTPEQAVEAIRKLGKLGDAALAKWVTEDDGTAAIVDARRRALKLIS